MSGLLGNADDEAEDETDDSDDLFGGTDDGLMGDDDGLMGGGLGFDEGDGGSDDDEVNYRLDEVEKEVDSLQNKVETVRGENEKISESISNVERNVDKLVELYEIVTQGINPFVGDQEIGNAFETAVQEGFGGADDPANEIDDEIAEASAEDFLDDELEEDEDERETFFDEEVLDDESAGEELPPDDESAGDREREVDDEIAADFPADDVDDEIEEDERPEAADGSALSAGGETPDPTSLGAEGDANGDIGDPPYLVQLPSRADAEVATLEWIQFLVDAAGVDGAARSIAYYESIGWLSASARTHLHAMLNGFGDGSTVADDDPEPRSVLSADEHKRSLQFIAWIAAPEQEPDLFGEDDDARTTRTH